MQPLQAILCARPNIPWKIQNLRSEQTTDYYAVSNTCVLIHVDRIFMNIFFIVGSFLVQLLFSLRRIPHADKFSVSCMWRPHKRADIINCRWAQSCVCEVCQVTENRQWTSVIYLEQTTSGRHVGNTKRIRVFWPLAQSPIVFKNMAWRKDHYVHLDGNFYRHSDVGDCVGAGHVARVGGYNQS